MEVHRGTPSLYVGETSRSIQERALEHWGGARRNDKDNHMVKHQLLEHRGEQPSFHFKVVSTHRTALSRQIREAVRIRRRGGAGNILNSKAEYNRCHIPRLVVAEEDEEQAKQMLIEEQKNRDSMENLLGEMDSAWEQRKTREQEQAIKKRRLSYSEGEQVTKRRRKMKFKLMDENWGAMSTIVECDEVENMEPVKECDDYVELREPVNDCDENVFVTPRPPPPARRSKRKRFLTTPSVAEYFGRSTKRRMDDTSTVMWSDDDKSVLEGYDEFLSRTVEGASQGYQIVSEGQAKETQIGLMSKQSVVSVTSCGVGVEDTISRVQGVQPVSDGQDIKTLKNEVSEMSCGMRLVSEEHHTLGMEHDNGMNEDDMTEFLEDDSWEVLADNTLSMLVNKQSCLENGVTNPDHPVPKMVVTSTGLPVSSTDHPTPTQCGMSTGSPVSSRTRGEEIPNLIGWATTLVDDAFRSIAVTNDNSTGEEWRDTGYDDNTKPDTVLRDTRRTGHDDPLQPLSVCPDVTDSNQEYLRTKNILPVTPSMDKTSNHTGKRDTCTFMNFTITGVDILHTPASESPQAAGTRVVEEDMSVGTNTIHDTSQTPDVMVAVERGTIITRDPDLADVVTPVGKLRNTLATDTPTHGTKKNFTGTSLDNIFCAATETGDNIVTSTPVRAEPGTNQEPVLPTLQGVTVGDPDRLPTSCQFERGGRCLLHKRQAKEMFRPGWG